MTKITMTPTDTVEHAILIDAELLKDPKYFKVAKAIALKYPNFVGMVNDVAVEGFPPVQKQKVIEEKIPKHQRILMLCADEWHAQMETNDLRHLFIKPKSPGEFKNEAEGFLKKDTVENQFKKVMILLEDTRDRLDRLPSDSNEDEDEDIYQIAAKAANNVLAVYDTAIKQTGKIDYHKLARLFNTLDDNKNELSGSIKAYLNDKEEGAWFKIPRPIRFILGILTSLTLIIPAVMIGLKGSKYYKQTFFYETPKEAVQKIMENFKEGMRRLDRLTEDIDVLDLKADGISDISTKSRS